MNIRKTAATALTRAGGPAAVPKLLHWLGAHDNPGLREAIVTALRGILGDAFTATLTAAAEATEDTRTRDLLLAAVPEPKDEPAPDPDVKALTDLGWDPEPGRRLARRTDLDPTELRDLRPMLDRWLDLAATDTEALRFALRLCPAPWTDHEVRSFARSAETLVNGLADLTGDDRERLVAALETALPRLPETGAAEIAERLRALPAATVGGRDLLVLLRRSGASLSRADLDRALSAAPWQDLEAVLREALGAEPLQGADPHWRDALREAVGTPAGLRRFRSADHPVGSRERLDALIRVYPEADTDARAVLLDWMTGLQPVDAPPWTLTETLHQPPEHRAVHPEDLDQPRSAAQRARLLAMLEDPNPDRRATAARALADWPEPEIRLTLLRAFLNGRVDLTPTPDLARALAAVTEDELDAGDTTFRLRTARAAAHLDATETARLAPRLLAWWRDGTPGLRSAVAEALRGAAPDPLADHLAEADDETFPLLLNLLAHRPLLSTPALRKALQRARDTGHGALADRFTLVEGPVRRPGADLRDTATLAAMRVRTRPPAVQTPTREDLLRTARTGTPEQVRRALSALAADHPGPRLAALLIEAIGHPERRVRLHAHRLARTHLDRPAYLEQTARLLDDPATGVVRSAIRTLSHARWTPLIPTLVDLLLHPDPVLRKAAAEGLTLFGTRALPALRHAEGRARPDRRPRYTEVIEEIAKTAG